MTRHPVACDGKPESSSVPGNPLWPSPLTTARLAGLPGTTATLAKPVMAGRTVLEACGALESAGDDDKKRRDRRAIVFRIDSGNQP